MVTLLISSPSIEPIESAKGHDDETRAHCLRGPRTHGARAGPPHPQLRVAGGRARGRGQRDGVKPPEGGGKPDRSSGPPSIPRVFCGTQEGCIEWSSMRRCGAACMWRGGASARRRRRFGLARETVRTMLRDRLPPGYRRQKPIRCPKLEAFTGVIGQILRDDQHRPKKQRHTATRICERLRAEHDFTGRLHDRQSLRARAEAGRARDVCAARASTGATPRPTSAKRWWSSTASHARRTTWSWICRTATTRL